MGTLDLPVLPPPVLGERGGRITCGNDSSRSRQVEVEAYECGSQQVIHLVEIA
jgi:hypothetical protein